MQSGNHPYQLFVAEGHNHAAADRRIVFDL